MGDRIIVLESSYAMNAIDVADELIVEKVGVMTTYFINAINGCGVYLRNAKISHAKLINLSRGGRINIHSVVRTSCCNTNLILLIVPSRLALPRLLHSET